jgi:hypothetical protein
LIFVLYVKNGCNGGEYEMGTGLTPFPRSTNLEYR